MNDKNRVSPKVETEVLTNSGITVTLAGKTYTVKPLPIGRDMQWRNKLADVIGNMTSQLTALGVVDVDENGNAKVEAEKHLDRLLPLMIGSSFDDFIELVFLYSPELQKDKKRILDNVDVDEFIDAGIQVFRLAGGRVKKILNRTEDIMNAMVGVMD